MSAAGTVTVRFDVQGNEKLLQTLITTATGAEKVNTSMVKLQSTLGGIGVGNLGPLNNIATSVKATEAAMGTATTKITTFKEKLANIGTQLGQNATSFGVATASVWGIYNAYDSLEKVQIRAHAAATKVMTLETSLATLTEKRRLAVEKGNLTGEQMALLNEKIANTTEKLSVAQERNADVAQDVQEAWAGFFSTVGPQAIAATGSIVQLGTVFKSSFAGGGGFINTIKTAFTNLIPSLAKARAESLILSPALGGLAPKADQASSAFGKLKSALGGIGVGGGLALGGLAAAGGLLIALAVDSMNTANKVRELQMALKDLEVGSSAAFTNIAQQAKTFNQSLVGQIGGALADSNKTIFGTTPIVGFNFREVFEKRLQEDTGTIRADIAKNLETIMSGATASLARDISPETKSNIDAGVAKLKAYLIDTSKKNFATPESTLTTFDVMKPIAAKLQADLEALPKLIAGGKVDISGLMTKQAAQVKTFAQAIVKDLGGAAKAASVPTSILNSNIDLLIQSMVAGGQVAPEMANAIKAATADIIKASQEHKGFEVQLSTLTGKTAEYRSSLITLPPAYKGMTGAMAEMAKKIDDAKNKTEDFSGIISAQSPEVIKNKDTFLELSAGLKGYMDVTDATMGQLESWKKMNADIVIAIQDQKQAITDSAEFWDRMKQSTFDAMLADNKWITAHTNVTKILDGGRESVLAFSEAQKEGTIAAQDWFTNMVLGTVKTQTMTKAIADSAKAVGIHADMMSFSAGKAQELIATTYEMNTGFEKQAIAAAYSVEWLNNKKIIDTQLTAGTIEGAQAANDWTASMIKSVEATQTEHDQLVVLAESMTGLSDLSGLTSEQLQKLMTGMRETGDAAGSMAAVMRDQLVPIFEPFKEFLTATNWKDFKSAFKDLDLKKLGIPKDLRESLKDAGKDLLHVNENALEAKTGLSALFTVAFTGRSKGIKSGIKEFLDDLKEIPTMGDLTPFTNQLEAIMDLPKEERAAAFKKMGPAIAEMMKALAPDEMGFVIITPEEIDKINAALGGTGSAAQSSVTGINALNSSLGAIFQSYNDLVNLDWDKVMQQPVTPVTNLGISGAVSDEASKIFSQPKTPAITPPPPVVFPPPNIDNIIAGVAKAETELGSILDFAGNLVLSFPPMDIDAIKTGIASAEVELGSIIDFVSGLVLAFPAMDVSTVTQGIEAAEEILGSVIDFVGGLVLSFPPLNVDTINQGIEIAEEDLGSVIDFMAGLKLVFQKPDTKPVTVGATIANATIKTVETFIKGMKLVFQKPDIRGIITSCDASVKRMQSLEGVAKGLKLVFPKPDISQIEKGVKEAQSKIDSLHAKNVTNTITTHYETTGTKPKARGGVEYRETATNTTWGEAGPEVAVFMPLTRAGQPRKGDYDIRIPSPVLDTAGLRNMLKDRGSMPAISSGGEGGGPTTVNVTTEVYLFPGSDMFKKFVKSIMLEEMSRYATA